MVLEAGVLYYDPGISQEKQKHTSRSEGCSADVINNL